MFHLIYGCSQDLFNRTFALKIAENMYIYSEKARTPKNKMMQTRSTNRAGDSGGALASFGVAKGSQTEFCEWKAGSLAPPGPPDGVHFIWCKVSEFFVWSQLLVAITRSGPGEDGFPRTGWRINLGSFLFPFGFTPDSSWIHSGFSFQWIRKRFVASFWSCFW